MTTTKRIEYENIKVGQLVEIYGEMVYAICTKDLEGRMLILYADETFMHKHENCTDEFWSFNTVHPEIQELFEVE